MRELRRHERCLNCGEAVPGDFCSRCGQENTDYRVSLRRLLGDLFEELFQLESRLWRTLGTLVRRPGLLSVEYNAGRRARYTTPLRLYLVASVAYFAVASVMPSEPATVNARIDEEERQEIERATADETSPFKKRLREHVLALAKADPQAVGQRVTAALQTQVPKAMLLLVPAMALFSWLLLRRPRLFFVEHLVLALHVHAFAFLLLLVAKLTRSEGVTLLAAMGAWVWMLLALRRVFDGRRWVTFFKAALIGVAYCVLLSLVLMAITVATLWFA